MTQFKSVMHPPMLVNDAVPVEVLMEYAATGTIFPMPDKDVEALRKENQDLRDRLEFVLQGKEIHETAFRYWKLKR